MPKRNKKELSKIMNTYLGTNINFAKLSEKELTELVKIFDDPVDLSQRYMKAQALLRMNERMEQGKGLLMQALDNTIGG